MNFNKCNPECWERPVGLFIGEYDIDTKDMAEKDNAQILSLYRQMKLQRAFEQCKDLDSNFKKSQMYTNGRLMGEIAQKIDDADVNYPKSYQSLVEDMNSNIILTSVQLKKQHLQTNPLKSSNFDV